jgi:hypothetical protein
VKRIVLFKGKTLYEPNPERLTEGAFGQLLNEANRQFAKEVDQRAAFQQVTERLSTPRTRWPRRTYRLVPATVLVLTAIVATPTVALIAHRMRSAATPVLVAEDLRGFHSRPVVAPSAFAVAPPPAEPAKTPHADGNRMSTTKLSAQAANTRASADTDGQNAPPRATESPAAQPAAVSDAAAADQPSASAPGEINSAVDCLSLARRGQTRGAEACFLKRAEGSGLGAEMALYEVARLRRDVLADPTGALAALAEYRRRFPAGALRREADMSQLELLLQLGRSDEALRQSDELLSSSSSGERAAELHLLRGNILRKAQSRFADAEHEYQLAERAGARGGEVTYFRALCLEALGRAPEAAALFRQYLEQPQRPYAEDALRRLRRLEQ